MIVDDLCGTLSADAMMGDLAEFAKRVKLSGTASIERSRNPRVRDHGQR